MTTNNKNGVQYISETTYVDIETGQILTKKVATDRYKYIIIKIRKDETQYSNNNTKCTTKYTGECRKQPQLRLL